MKAMILLTNEEKELYENQEICHICEKQFCTDKDNKKEFKLKEKVRPLSLHRKIQRYCS